MKNSNLIEFIRLSRELAEYSMTMQNATNYKKGKFNYAYFALIRQRAIKEMEVLGNEQSKRSS